MRFSYEWLQSYFEEKLPKPEKLAELLTLRSFETEADGDILDVDITPNRIADCASHLGIAREISLVTNYELRITNYELKKGEFKTEDYVSVEVQEKDLCPKYVALVIKNVEVKESPEWMQKRLSAIGQKSINNIVDSVNYAMLETGQPLHAFDLDKLDDKKIIVRKATAGSTDSPQAGESIETLDDQKVNLTSNMLVIADGKDPLVIAGIKGGKKAEITNSTKDVVIESAIFDGPNIRQTSKATGIITDASYRFEHGLSLFLPEIGMERVAQLICEVAGGEIAGDYIDTGEDMPVLPDIKVSEGEIEKKLGVKIDQEKIDKILNSLSLKERTDINIKEDLIEEVARIYGYENIPSQLPGETKIQPEKNEEYLYSNWIKGILAGLGFSEVYNYSFWESGIHELQLKNPISKEKAYLRENLLNGLRKSVEENFKNFDTVKLFEVGKVFYPDEKIMVAITVGHKNNKKEVVEAELRGVAEALLVDDANNYIKDNVFEISLEDIIKKAKENGVDLAQAKEFESEDYEYKPFSKYPAIVRDISLFVPAGTQIIEAMNVIENTAGELLVDTDLFDMYEPSGALAEGGEPRKSLAFRLIFQSLGKTLTDKEVNEIMKKIISALEENTKWEVRK